MNDTTIIAQTQNWIKSVVIACNFCPFAAKALLKEQIRYAVFPAANVQESLEALMKELYFLDRADDFETSFLIFPNDFKDFSDYLDLVDLAEELLAEQGYDGIYQIASFHPDYCFAGAASDDPANYTNRSIYPMLHILREESVTKALADFPDAEHIPQRNIDFAQQKGLKYMQLLRAACMD